MVELFIYIDGEPKRVELFEDEKISVTQNIQNFQDIAKLLSDYSQSFTLPASPRNNSIFSHWYNSAVENGFDSRYRYEGFIKINLSTFKVGSIQLLSATIKDRQVTDYRVTFYGKVKQIKDVIGDDKLNALNYNSISFPYTAFNVKNKILSTGLPSIIFPMIAHNRLYTYGDGAATDVSTTTGAIVWNTLFPAVRCLDIISLMEIKYGFEFSQSFLYADPFKYLYLLFKNAETMTQVSEPLKVNFTSKTSGFDSVNLTTDEITFRQVQFIDGEYKLIVDAKLRVIPTDPNVTYRVQFYKNGTFFYEYPNVLQGDTTIGLYNLLNNENISIYIISNSPMNFTTGLAFGFQNIINSSTVVQKSASSNTQSTTTNLNVANYAPDLKLYDFFMGLVKTFNLVIVPNGEDKFLVMPLEEWYNLGKVLDLTQYTIAESINIEQPKIYKELSFKHQKSESVTNFGFNQTFATTRGFEWGDSIFKTDFDTTTSKYEVTTPFEDVLFTKQNNFEWATLKNKTLNNYIPKGMLFYWNGAQSVNPTIKYNNGLSIENLNTYVRVSNERVTNTGLIASINFNEEKNVWNPTEISTGLFTTYYKNMIQGLYNPKSRLVKCKMMLPTSILLSLKLNDKVILKQKRYVINSITTDLTTGETDIELITDFRALPIDELGRVTGVTNVSQLNLASNNELAPVQFLNNEFPKFDVIDSGDWLSGSYPISSGNTTPVLVDVTPPENTETLPRYSAIPAIFYDVNEEEYPFQLPVIQYSYFPLELFADEEEIIIDNTAQSIDPLIYIGLNQKMSIEKNPSATWATATDVYDVTVDTNFPVEIDANTSGLERSFYITITYTSPLETVYTKLLNITQNA